MIRKLRLSRYKAFSQFEVLFQPGLNVLVGPNNAGKSTIIAVLRLCSILSRYAQRFNPSLAISDGTREVVGYPLAAAKLRDLPGFTDENVHHEFRSEEARVALHSASGSCLTVVWPHDDESYFYFDTRPGMNARTRAQVASVALEIGIVPGLAPVDNNEELLTPKYVNSALGSRLTSKHFRNHLYHLSREDGVEYGRVLEFLCSNTPEIGSPSIQMQVTARGAVLDLFFTEVGTRSEREVFWAGDGLQIWLQVLFHAFRQRNLETLVLDEPDVFLHPDLQRRLVSMLEVLGPQVILATHAPEVIAEADREAVIAVDRSRKTGRRVRDATALDRLVVELGSAFDLGIARALRSRVVLFVEGDDMKILRVIADVVGAKDLSRERSHASVIKLGGYSNWPMIEPFAWMKEHLLPDSVKVFVILDRDYRTSGEAFDVVTRLANIEVVGHVWGRKELESYLLAPSAVARVSGLPVATCDDLIEEAVDGLASTVEANIFAGLTRANKGVDPKTLHAMCRTQFVNVWSNVSERVKIVPAKDLISNLSSLSVVAGGRSISARKLAASIRVDEVDQEMVNVLLSIESAIAERARPI